jgi:hypothetical protein
VSSFLYNLEVRWICGSTLLTNRIIFVLFFARFQSLDPLPALLVKDQLEEPELLECKKVIYRVVAMEHHNEALPVPASGIRGKGVKRLEQKRFKMFW